jgi:SAM-dependent methyltransferase
MNLIDLIKRKDRSVTELSFGVSISSCVRDDLQMNTVELSPPSHIRIENAQEFVELKSYPTSIGWKWTTVATNSFFRKRCSPVVLKIRVVNENAGFEQTLFSAEVREEAFWHDILLKWPPWVGHLDSFALVVTCEFAEQTKNGEATAKAAIGISPSFDSRSFIPEFIKGEGVEVGPGLKPHIVPTDGIDVRYIESLTAEEWIQLYKKSGKPPDASMTALWEKYILSSAQRLENVEDCTLDFIFSNHVFEHLMNPVGVLEHWSRKLRPGGLVYNVIPDAHACFDLRQPLSTAEEWLAEYRENRWETDLGKYERWCTYTAPYNTPENLIERKYSIHVHYYSPTSAAALAALAIKQSFFSNYFIGQSWNHKDFALILSKE